MKQSTRFITMLLVICMMLPMALIADAASSDLPLSLKVPDITIDIKWTESNRTGAVLTGSVVGGQRVVIATCNGRKYPMIFNYSYTYRYADNIGKADITYCYHHLTTSRVDNTYY